MYDDPMNPYGFMPEIPTMNDGDENNNIHLLGCLHVAVGLAAIFVLSLMTILILSWF